MRHHSIIKLLIVCAWVIVLPNTCWGANPIGIQEGEFRLGDSPQTPEAGLAWLTIDTEGTNWVPFLTGHGHSASEFTNVWRRFRLPETVVSDPTLYLTGWPSFEAYVDGRMIYRAGFLFPEATNKLSTHAGISCRSHPTTLGSTSIFERSPSDRRPSLLNPGSP